MTQRLPRAYNALAARPVPTSDLLLRGRKPARAQVPPAMAATHDQPPAGREQLAGDADELVDENLDDDEDPEAVHELHEEIGQLPDALTAAIASQDPPIAHTTVLEDRARPVQLPDSAASPSRQRKSCIAQSQWRRRQPTVAHERRPEKAG